MTSTKSLSNLVTFSDVFGNSASAEGVIWHIYLLALDYSCLSGVRPWGEWGKRQALGARKLLADHGVTFQVKTPSTKRCVHLPIKK
jgi:hypothetical protein